MTRDHNMRCSKFLVCILYPHLKNILIENGPGIATIIIPDEKSETTVNRIKKVLKGFQKKYWKVSKLHPNENRKKDHTDGQFVKKTFLLKSIDIPTDDQYTSIDSEVQQEIHEISSASEDLLCSECGKVFISKYSMENHVYYCHQKQYIPYPCPVCKKEFKLKPELNKHMKIHGPRSHSCTLCPKAFKTKLNLNAHKKLHNNERKFECSVCFKRFKVKGNLEKHSKLHNMKISDYYLCKNCDKFFSRLSNCKRHEERC